MDTYNLRLSFFGLKNIKERVMACPALNRLTIKAIEGDIKEKETFCYADVILVNLNYFQTNKNELLENKADYAVLVLVLHAHEFHMLSTEEKTHFTDIWVNDSGELIDYRIETFLARMRDTLDHELAEKQLDSLIDSVPDLIWFKDVRGSHIKVNDSFCKTVQKTKDQIKYRGHCYIWDLDMSEYEQGEYVCMETEEVVIEEQGTFLFDEKVKIGDEMRQLKTYKTAIVGRNGETVGTVGLARDVTEIWNTHEEFQTLISNLPLSMMIVNKNFEFIKANDSFYELFEIKKNAQKNFSFQDFEDCFFDEKIALPKVGNVSVKRSLIKNGSTRTFIVEKSEIKDVFNEVTGYFYIFRDITLQKEYEDYLRSMSSIDELTKLNNRKAIRSYFDSCYNRLQDEATPFAVAMLDLDCFKQYNDNYGHVDGDSVLVKIGEILSKLQEDKDLFVGRYGGEEFIILAQNKSLSECEEIIQQTIKQVVDENIRHEYSLVSNIVTVSIGMTYYNSIGDFSVSKLIEQADLTLYESKHNGRNQYVIKELH